MYCNKNDSISNMNEFCAHYLIFNGTSTSQLMHFVLVVKLITCYFKKNINVTRRVNYKHLVAKRFIYWLFQFARTNSMGYNRFHSCWVSLHLRLLLCIYHWTIWVYNVFLCSNSGTLRGFLRTCSNCMSIKYLARAIACVFLVALHIISIISTLASQL